jgi:hypothetical protein
MSGGSLTGVIIEIAHVYGNAVTGVKFSKAVNGRVRHSVVHDNGRHRILYSGSGAAIFNNLVYSNGCTGGGDNGISILGVAGFSNDGHTITNNTIYGNLSGGLRLSDNQVSSVFGIALNNIIMANPSASRSRVAGVSPSTTTTSSVIPRITTSSRPRGSGRTRSQRIPSLSTRLSRISGSAGWALARPWIARASTPGPPPPWPPISAGGRRLPTTLPTWESSTSATTGTRSDQGWVCISVIAIIRIGRPSWW